jgi:hypothetical protein
MRLIKVNVPEGKGQNVIKTAFSVNIKKATAHPAESFEADGTVERREVIDMEASTPQAKVFIDRLLQSDYFDRRHSSVAVRETRSIVCDEDFHELTIPLIAPITDIYEELLKFSHLTTGFLGRAFISGALLSYGLLQQQILLMIAGLLFLPLLPLLLAIGFGTWTRKWSLALQGFATFCSAMIVLLIAGLLVGAIIGPPVRYSEFNSVLAGLVISLGVGIAAGLSIIDDVARRELIGLAATAQIAIIPAWIGVCLAAGFPETVLSRDIAERLISFGANTLTIIIAALAVYFFTCGRMSLKEKKPDSMGHSSPSNSYRHGLSKIG